MPKVPKVKAPKAPKAPSAPKPPAAAKGEKKKPMTPEEIEAKIQAEGLNDWPPKDELADELLGDKDNTQDKFSDMVPGAKGPERRYHEDRDKLHAKIIDTLLRQRKEVPVWVKDADGKDTDVQATKKDGTPKTEWIPDPEGVPLTPSGLKRVLMMGGGTASGKSSALEANPDAMPDAAVLIDPDEIKSFLPEYTKLIQGESKYSATAVHEESSDIAQMLRAAAVAKGLNIVLDGTGDSKGGAVDEKTGEKKPSKFAQKLLDFKADGYDVEMFYVNATVQNAVVRAIDRAQKSGRWVPTPEIHSQHQKVSGRFLDSIKPLVEDGTVSRIRMFDTNSDNPILFAEGGKGQFNVVDQNLYDGFEAKADAPDYTPPGTGGNTTGPSASSST